MSSVPESNAFRNMDFLIRLGWVKQQRERKEILEVLTTEQIQGIGEVARCIARGQISILGQDWCKFKEYVFFCLQILSSSHHSDDRKRNLTMWHDIIQRRLSRSYIKRVLSAYYETIPPDRSDKLAQNTPYQIRDLA